MCVVRLGCSGFIHRRKRMSPREVADYKNKLKARTETLIEAGEKLREEWEITMSNVSALVGVQCCVGRRRSCNTVVHTALHGPICSHESQARPLSRSQQVRTSVSLRVLDWPAHSPRWHSNCWAPQAAPPC